MNEKVKSYISKLEEIAGDNDITPWKFCAWAQRELSRWEYNQQDRTIEGDFIDLKTINEVRGYLAYIQSKTDVLLASLRTQAGALDIPSEKCAEAMLECFRVWIAYSSNFPSFKSGVEIVRNMVRDYLEELIEVDRQEEENEEAGRAVMEAERDE